MERENSQIERGKTPLLVWDEGKCNFVKALYSPVYNVWQGMKQRCNNPKNKNYYLYGGRGIKICEQWSNNFKEFERWALENGYEQGLTIDRINNNGNYEPDNCRWADLETQANNTRRNVYIEYQGQIKTMRQWSKDLSIPYKTMKKRHERGLTAGELLFSGNLSKLNPEYTLLKMAEDAMRQMIKATVGNDIYSIQSAKSEMERVCNYIAAEENKAIGGMPLLGL